jgi:hypothetical protein
MKSKVPSSTTGSSSHPDQQRFQLTDDCSEILSRLGFDFISAPESDGIILFADRRRGPAHRTIAITVLPALDELRQVLSRCYQTLGCDSVIFVCPNVRPVSGLTERPAD